MNILRRHYGLLLFGLVLFQLVLFRQYVYRELAWAYPGSFDQAVYLHKTYDLFHRALEHGPGTALSGSLREGGPTGVLLPIQGAFMQFFFGSNRFAVLLVNFAYYALLQVVIFVTARWLTGRTAFGWLAVGLLLLEHSPFFWAGGLFDFRMDFVASCLYATFLCLLVRSDGLRDRRWLLGAAACAVLLFCFRFLTVVYLVGFFLTLWTLLLGLCFLPLTKRTHGVQALTGLRRSGLTAGAFLVVALPMVALNWQPIHDYYVIHHVTSTEKSIRAAELGITGLTGHLSYYLGSLVTEHLGTPFTVAWLVLAVVGLVVGLPARQADLAPPVEGTGAVLAPGHPDRLIALVTVVAGVIAPWVVLTLNEHKTPVVVNILAPAMVLLLLVLLAAATRSPRPASLTASAWWAVAVPVVFLMGLGHAFNRYCSQGDYSARRPSVEQINALHDYLADRTLAYDLNSPVLAADEVRDWMGSDTVNAAIYERTGRRLKVRGSLGSDIFALTREEVIAQLAVSDFVLLSTFPKDHTYPFYATMRTFAPDIRAWCEEHLLRGRDFRVDGATVTTYVRASVPVEGLSGEWITPEGVSVKLDGPLCEQLHAAGKRALVLEGELHRAWLRDMPRAVATTGRPDGPGLPASFKEIPGDRYQVRVELGEALAAPGNAGGIHVFLRLTDASFVPKEIGMNADSRRLVVLGPTRKTFE